jgi:CheY-like chemotaxis protein
VQAAGGALRVDSVAGQGTTFGILLPPAAPERPAGVDTLTDANRDQAQPPTERSGQSTILLVEDEPGLRLSTRRLLERAGYAVLEAMDGQAALQLWQSARERIDLLLTDLRMPRLGGDDLIALVRADAPSLPVVVMSGYHTDQLSSRRGPRAGESVRRIDKPFTSRVLLEAVAASVGASAD